MHPEETGIFKDILIASSFIAVILAFFCVTIIRQHRRAHALYISNIKSGIIILENERMNMAADIHDELGPLLSASKMALECLDLTMVENQAYKEKAIVYIDAIIAKMRNTANGLMPGILINKGPVQALHEFITVVGPDSKIKFYLEADFDGMVNPSTDLHIYRILQEIIHNTIKHSYAGVCRISIVKEPAHIIIKTVDDGIGFQKNNASKAAGMGINNIKRRVDILGGELNLKTAYNKGTAYHIKIPIAQV